MKKIKNWKTKFLSEAGKEVLMKSVIQALPVYCMSCFKIPKGICNDLTKMTAEFWWGKGERGHTMHWIRWDKMTEAKEEGGLGFRDLEAFNNALLGKQIWRFIAKPNLLMSRVLKNKYFPKSDIFQAVSKPRDSWIWKSWNAAKSLIQEGSC